MRLGLEPATQVIGEAMAWQFAGRVAEAYDGRLDTVDKVAATVVSYVLGLSSDLAEHLHTTADLAEHLARVCRGSTQRRRPCPGR